MMRLHVALVVVAQDDDSEEADAASQIPAEFQGGVYIQSKFVVSFCNIFF